MKRPNKILHTVKFYNPSKGGMESVVQDIVEGVIEISPNIHFSVYANSHLPLFKKVIQKHEKLMSIKEFTPVLIKSQPLSIRYPSLKNLLIETDIIHHHYPFPNMELALLREKNLLLNKKLIITWHANIQNSRWSWIEKFYNPVIKKLLDMSAHIVVTSQQLINNSEILKNYKKKITVIPLSFNPSFSSLNISRQFPDKRHFKLLFVGKLRTYKGLSYLINAISDLEVELTIVGDGESEQNLQNQVRNLNLGHKVTFLKGISNQELSLIYKNSDIFVLPSINEAEAFGVVQLEAMSNGLPVINTSLKSGVPFVSLNGVTGFTVNPESSEDLKSAIKKLISDKDLYESLSKNAIDRSNKFTREKMANSYLKLYNS